MICVVREELANLTDLEVLEVSLVAKPANKKRFLLFKSEEGREVEELTKMEESEEEAFSEPVQAVELSEKAVRAVKGALKILNEYRDELPSDALSRLAALAGYGGAPAEGKAAKPYGYRPYGYGYGYGPGYGYRKSVETEGEERPEFDLSAVPEDIRAKLEVLIKQGEDATKRAHELEEEKRLAEFVTKAKDEYPHLSATPEEIGGLMKDVSNTLPEEAKSFLERLLKSAEAAVSQAMQPVGTSSVSDESQSSWERIEKAAEHLRGEAGLTRAQAIAKVLETQPELYRDYLAEKEAR